AVASHDPAGRLVLFMDQMEGLFIHADDHTVARFLDLLADLADDPAVCLIASIRADFYDRPLLHHRFGPVFTSSVVNVHPLSPEDLAAAAIGPAERTGVKLEPALVSELIRDVA